MTNLWLVFNVIEVSAKWYGLIFSFSALLISFVTQGVLLLEIMCVPFDRMTFSQKRMWDVMTSAAGAMLVLEYHYTLI